MEDRLALGLATGLALAGCQDCTSLEGLDESHAAFAVRALQAEAVGAERRNDALNAGRFREAKVLDAFPFPQVELDEAVFSAIKNVHAGVVTLTRDRGGNLSTPICYAFEGNPETPVDISYLPIGVGCNWRFTLLF